MEELSIEEKARAYDEATKVIKDNLDALNEITETGAEVVNIQSIKNCFYRAFPELKESEDERIRKELLQFVDINTLSIDERHDRWIAWLEKQGKSSSKVHYPALSDEDKRKLGRIYSILGQAADEHAFSNTCRLIGDKECVELQDFLKSLKDRVGCEVNCTTTKEWKPSDEQIEVLTWCLPLFVEPRSKAVLQSLINDLKKLKEE